MTEPASKTDREGPSSDQPDRPAEDNRRKPHTFISFKTEERETALLLKKAMEDGGFSVWWQEDIQCGREWHDDIDAALLSAGCVVVLWSKEALASPWVRHEASQAMARGIYTPVRIEALDIGSPFDHIQATDLPGWNGDSNHPGLQRLLARLDELIPERPTAWQRILRLARSNAAVIAVSFFAAAAIALLVSLSVGLQRQLDTQANITKSLERTLDPLTDIRVSAYLNIEPDMPGVTAYLGKLSKALALKPGQELRIDSALPPGLSVSSYSGSGVVNSLQITPDSPLWPANAPGSWLGTVSRFVDVRLEFSRGSTSPSGPADLSIQVSSMDYDGSDKTGPQGTSSILWTLRGSRNTLSLIFEDRAAKEHWKSNRKVSAVPDLSDSRIKIEILSNTFEGSSDPATRNGISISRGALSLSSFFLNFSGRDFEIEASDLEVETGANGLRTYRGLFKDVAKPY